MWPIIVSFTGASHIKQIQKDRMIWIYTMSVKTRHDFWYDQREEKVKLVMRANENERDVYIVCGNE